jgi:hypothetical protein
MILNEDHHVDSNQGEIEVSFRYGVCVTANGTEHFFSEDVGKLAFNPGDMLTLNLQEDTEAEEEAGRARSLQTGPLPNYVVREAPLYRVKETLSWELAPQVPRGRNPPNEERDLIIIRVKYANGEPSCDEACVREGMFRGNDDTIYGYEYRGNVADQVYESSFGQTFFPESKARVVTVTLDKSMETQYCPTGTLASDADARLKLAPYFIDSRSYTHREYWLPSR